MTSRDVDVVLTRVPQRNGEALWLVEVDGVRLPRLVAEDGVHEAVDCHLFGRSVRERLDFDGV